MEAFAAGEDVAHEGLGWLASLVETSDYAFVGIGLDGTILRWSPGAERLSGFPPCEAIGRPITFVFVPERRDEIGPLLLRVGAGESVEHDSECVRRDGARIAVSFIGAPVRASDGRVIGAAAIARDVTAKRAVEAEARRSERRYRELVEQASDGIFIADRDGRYVDVNGAGCRQLGYTREELLEKSITDLLPEEMFPRLEAARARMFARPGVVDIDEWRLRRKDGHYVPFEVSAKVLPDGRWQGFMRDITERKRAEESLHASRAQLRAVVDNLLEGVLLADAGGRVVLVNAAARSLSGSRAGELLESALLGALPCQTRARHADGRPFLVAELPLSRALAGETVRLVETTIEPEGEERPRRFQISAAPIRDAAGRITHAVASWRDVTELVELDLLKDQFIRVAAHELKTPVTVVKGYAATLAATGPPLPPSQRRLVGGLLRGAERITRIVEDLLLLSQVQLGRLRLVREPVDLDELARAAAKRHDDGAGAHRLRVSSPGSVIAQADRHLLGAVIDRLVDNAIRYSPGGGEIEVSVGTNGQDGIVTVSDHGIGIPRCKQGRIFECFYRAHSGTQYDYGGLGVGLFLSRAVVARHGGSITFESREGEGTTFRVRLPRGADVSEPCARAPRAGGPRARTASKASPRRRSRGRAARGGPRRS